MVAKLLDTPASRHGLPVDIGGLSDEELCRCIREFWLSVAIDPRRGAKARQTAVDSLACALGLAVTRLARELRKGASLAMLERIAAQAKDEPGRPRNR